MVSGEREKTKSIVYNKGLSSLYVSVASSRKSEAYYLSIHHKTS